MWKFTRVKICLSKTTEWKCTGVKICEGEIVKWKCTCMKIVKVRLPSGNVPVCKLSKWGYQVEVYLYENCQSEITEWKCTCVKIVNVRHQVEVYLCENLSE